MIGFATALLWAAALSTPVPTQDLACIVQMPDRMPAQGRTSPLDSVTFTVGGGKVKVCYGRPSARGRTMIGGTAVPHGRIWRTGANEPTMIHTTVPLNIAGIKVGPGTYSLYTVPAESAWTVIVNRSYSQWGHEGRYTDAIRGEEVQRAEVPVSRTDEHVEMFTIRASTSSNKVSLVLEWERTRVTIPVSSG